MGQVWTHRPERKGSIFSPVFWHSLSMPQALNRLFEWWTSPSSILYFPAQTSADLLPTASSPVRSPLLSRWEAAAVWRLCAAFTRQWWHSGCGVTSCHAPGWAHRTASTLPGKAMCAAPLVLRLRVVCRWYVCTRTYRLGEHYAWKLGGQGSTVSGQTAKVEVREMCSCLTTPLALLWTCTLPWLVPVSLTPSSQVGLTHVVSGETEAPSAPSTNSCAICAASS